MHMSDLNEGNIRGGGINHRTFDGRPKQKLCRIMINELFTF